MSFVCCRRHIVDLDTVVTTVSFWTKISIHLCKWDNVAFKEATIREPDSFLVAINESLELKSRYMGFWDCVWDVVLAYN